MPYHAIVSVLNTTPHFPQSVYAKATCRVQVLLLSFKILGVISTPARALMLFN